MADFHWIRLGRRMSSGAALVAVLVFVLAAAAQAAPLKPGSVAGASPKLTPRLQQLYTPVLRSAPNSVQAQRLSLPASGAGGMIRVGGEVVVTARVSSTSAQVTQALRDAGAQVMTVSGRYKAITVAVAPADLERIAAIGAVRSVEEELRPLTSAVGGLANSLSCPWGSVRSEGDMQLRAAEARDAFGVDGAGVKVGIISDSFDTNASAVTHWAGDISTGDLPGAGNRCGLTSPVQDLLDFSGGSDEGRAMAQVVHDLAPGAPLAFKSGFTSTSFPDAVTALQTAGAKVIEDDVTYLNEPFFQDGPNAVAANSAAAAAIPFFSSAGNSNVVVSGHNVSSWEAPSFRSTTCPAGVLPYSPSADCMNFDASGGTSNLESITLAPSGGFMLDMQWNEPWYGVSTNLDVYVLDNTGTVLAGSNSVNTGVSGTQKPYEALSYTNSTGANQTVYLAIARRPTTGEGNPRVKYVLISGGGILSVQFPTSSGGDVVGPTIFGHNGAPGAMSMAAVPYDDSSTVESFSSRGPVTHYYGPVTGTTPAAPLSSADVLAKPDASATDGAATTFFASLIGGIWRFYGTSESSPHAAAIAALQLQANPTATVNQIYDGERTTAGPVGSFGTDAAGDGLLNAFGAVNALVPLPMARTGTATSTSFSSAKLDGSIEPQGFKAYYRYDYGTTSAYGSSTAISDAGHGTGPVDVPVSVSGLLSNTLYHFRIVALRGTTPVAYGADNTFTTPAPPAPTVATGGASDVTVSAATISGTVNPQGVPTGYRFDYETTAGYGSSTPAGDAGAGSADVPVAANLTGLSASTTYHYRIVALRGGDVAASGSDQTFTTQPALIQPKHPPVNTTAPVIVGQPTPGVTLTCTPGSWQGAISFAYQWLRDAAPIFAGSSYRPSAADVGHQLACRVTASNADGSATAISADVVIVQLAPPGLASLKLSPTAFKAAKFGGSVVNKGKAATLVKFRLDERANVTFTVERAQPGRNVKGRCQRETRSNRKAKHCTLWTAVNGSFRINGNLGANSFRFTGRIGGRTLAPGSYRLIARARDSAGDLAKPVRVPFTIRR